MMPSHAVEDAFYGGIVGISISRTKHLLLSWKISERPLTYIAGDCREVINLVKLSS